MSQNKNHIFLLKKKKQLLHLGPRKSKEKKKGRGKLLPRRRREKKEKKKKKRERLGLENQKKKNWIEKEKRKKEKRQRCLEKKQKKKGNVTYCPGRRKKIIIKACAHGHFCQSRKNSSPLNFFFTFGRKHFGRLRRKHLGSTIYFLSPHPTKHTPKKFSFLFSHQNFLSTLFHLQTNTPLVSEKSLFTNYSTIMQEKKILNKMIKIMFKTIGSTKDVKSSLLIKHFLFVLSMNFASIFVVFVKKFLCRDLWPTATYARLWVLENILAILCPIWLMLAPFKVVIKDQ